MVDDGDAILNDVKKRLGIESETTEFDLDITSEINSAFFVLYQLGVGPSEIFDANEYTTWGEYNTTIPKRTILEYLYLRAKTIFDPPTSSTLSDAIKNRIAELEFRMNVQVDDGGGNVIG